LKSRETRFASYQRQVSAKPGLRERGDLQRLLRDQIQIISPDILIISEEFDFRIGCRA
jgi:hypothetical protein